MINIRTQIIIAIFIIIALYIIVNMIRKRQLELKYALAWLMVGIGILVLDIFPNSMIWLADVLGIAQPINMLFFVGFCFADRDFPTAPEPTRFSFSVSGTRRRS